jgi:hypothetical protein
MFQFLDGTWKQMVKEMGKDYSLEDKFDPKKAAEVMAYFTQKQKTQLEKGTGKTASNTDLYMAHFLGAGGATKFINAMGKDSSQSAAAMDPAAAKANKSIYYDKTGRERSLKEVYELMGSKIGRAEQAVDSGKWGGKAIPSDVLALGGGRSPSASPSNPSLAAAPSSSQVATAVTPDQKPVKDAAVAAAAAQSSIVGAGKTQETPESLLSSLNTKMDHLIKYTALLASISERQLTVQKGLSNDLYAA